MKMFDVELFENKMNKIVDNLKIIDKLEKENDFYIDFLIESLPDNLKKEKGTYNHNGVYSISTPYRWLNGLKGSNLRELKHSNTYQISLLNGYVNSDFRDFRKNINKYNEYKKEV